jgi:hypothetical protein
MLREKNYGIINFNNLLSPPSSAESNADDEELPTGIRQSFSKNCNFRTDTIDMDELVLAVKSLSSDKACGLDKVCYSNPKTK